MKDKLRKEWYLKTKWGKVAMISWGDRHKPGVLLVHGFMDSAATFEPLLSLLPDTHHHVSFDFPGHGKSDHVSTSQLVSHTFIVEIIKEIIKYLQWKSFVCITHSVGCILVLLYNHLYPGRLHTLVCIDPVLPVSQYIYLNERQVLWYKLFFEAYYDHYHLYHSAPPRLFKREQIIESTMESRHLTRQQAEIVLSRSLVPVENGMYRLSTQPIMRRLLTIMVSKDSFRHVLTHNIPMLTIHGKRTKVPYKEIKFAKELISYDSPNRVDVYIDADHDLHLTHPEELVPHIEDFLNGKRSKAKL